MLNVDANTAMHVRHISIIIEAFNITIKVVCCPLQVIPMSWQTSKINRR